jgi:hypothetical protein
MKLTGMKCAVCGCTDGAACVTEDGACHWADTGPDPLCSACVTKLADDIAEAGEMVLAPQDVAAAKRTGMVTIQMDFGSAMGLLGAIQLACSHPGFQGSTRETVRLIGEALQARLSITPAWGKIAAAGWKP